MTRARNFVVAGGIQTGVVETNFRDYRPLGALFRLEQPCPTWSGRSAGCSPRSVLGSSERRTIFAGSSSNHSLCVVTITRMPVSTSAASWRVNAICIAGCRYESGSSISGHCRHDTIESTCQGVIHADLISELLDVDRTEIKVRNRRNTSLIIYWNGQAANT